MSDTHARRRYAVLAALGLTCLLPAAVVGVEFVDARLDGTLRGEIASQADLPAAEREPIVPPADGVTVVTTQKFRRNALVAFAPDGRLLYHGDSLDRYHDVDPVPGTTRTVEFVGAEYEGDTTHLLVRRVNLSTGAVSERYRHAVPRTDRPHRWHDVDRLGPHRLLVADIARDAAFVVNTTTGRRSFEWSAQSRYGLDSGGPFPHDWTHINDVEVLPDGRYMLSLRNQDSVVFVEPDAGAGADAGGAAAAVATNATGADAGSDAAWTLGTDDAHAVLNEQHNPDYLPAAAGGPAVVVADSQNDRLVEYRRANGSWRRTWVWRDGATRWPRDADRLPNGHTLVGDTNGGRVLELDRRGEVVWSVDGLPSYDVERLGTGDESTGGPAAGAPGGPRPVSAANVTVERSAVRRFVDLVVPARLWNTVGFVAPLWLSPAGRLAALTGLVSAAVALSAAVSSVGRRYWRRRV